MKNMLKCAKCNTNYEIYDGWQRLDVNAGAVGLCIDCNEIKAYSTPNDLVVKGDKKQAPCFTFGWEVEGMTTDKKYLVLCNNLNNFIPTADSSLFDYNNEGLNGIELKSPIYKSLNGLKKTIWTASRVLDMTHSACGQHIHIGHEKWINYNTMQYIRKYYKMLFAPLCNEMLKENKHLIQQGLFPLPDKDLKYVEFFGRAFNSYANSIVDKQVNIYDNRSSYDSNFRLDVNDRYNFINVSGNNTIEFRLCKFNNVNQYYYLFEFNKDIMQTIINNFLEYVSDNNFLKNNEEKLQHKARLAGNKIVKVYEKYLQGNAHCQRESRNNKKW